ncbi:unnamed protein product [Lathyrus oleraceus]
MSQILKCVYYLIVSLCLFLVEAKAAKPLWRTTPHNYFASPCETDKDCFNKVCYRPLKRKCISSRCECVSRTLQEDL